MTFSDGGAGVDGSSGVGVDGSFGVDVGVGVGVDVVPALTVSATALSFSAVPPDGL